MKHGDQTPETIYKECIKTFDTHIKKLKKKDRLLSIFKLILFFLGLFFLFKLFSKETGSTPFIFGIFFILFVIAAIFHETILKKINHYKILKNINKNEFEMLSHQFSTYIDSGIGFVNPEHPYTSDLDIFGERSFFHYVNRTVTSIGRKCLAQWLQISTDGEEIKKRQEAVKELAGKLNFRQNLQSYGMDIDDTSQKLESLHRLFDESFFMKDKIMLIYFIHLFPIITVTILVLIFFELPLLVALAPIFIQLAINKVFTKKVSHLYRSASRNTKILKAYSEIIREIENESFNSITLNRLKKDLYQKERKASSYITQLATLMEWFDIRFSSLHPLMNNIFFWDLHCVYRIEKWKQEVASVIHRWFDVIGSVEALSSFANLYFNNPQWVLPEIYKDGFRIKAEGIGHPLIPQKERVCNDIILEQKGSILIVTGPNMAGKSTFLRTTGVNAVLALAGAPVCAEVFEISPLSIFTSMETSDSLDKHLSLFYAELQRLKMILDGISNKGNHFFLIDEMLKGTNPLDRQKGSIVLIKQLLRMQSTGMIATHDMELTKLETESEKIFNYHFDGIIKEDKLLFDYQLKKGTCKSFNALVLMKKMGIDL